MTAFLALLRRDVLVARRTAAFYLVSALTQPVLVVLVFGNILPRIGLVSEEFKTVMLPGLMSITMLMAGVQGVLMPLMTDLAGTREVDERLLAPIGVRAVAVERIVAGALHAAVGGLLAAAFGLTLGSNVQPRFSGLLFAVVIGPMMLFGCAYYPYASLSVLGPLRAVFLVNPLVFISEAMRLAVTPDVPHMALPLLVGGTLLHLLFFGWLGSRSFEKRTIL